jgi:hypothetical protein
MWTLRTFSFIARPDVRYAIGLPSEPKLTEATLRDAIPGAVIRALGSQQWGPRTVDIRLDRSTREQALDEIILVLRNFGFALGEIIISEWTDDAAQEPSVGCSEREPLRAGIQ